MSLSTRQPVFDPLDPSFLDDPYPHYERLRAAGALVRDGATQWVATRYDQVAALLRDQRLHTDWPGTFQQMRMGDGAAADFLQRVLLHREGRDHATLRRLLTAVMHLTAADEWRASVTRVVHARVDRALAAGHLDIVTDLAVPVPVAVACDMLGVPEGDVPAVQEWGLEIVKAFAVILPEPDRPGVHRAVAAMREYLGGMRRTASGRLARIFAACADGPEGAVDPQEAVDNLIFLLVSGFTTTVHAIATVGGILLARPGVYAELRADRSLLRGAVEECLRYEAPIQHVSRYAAQPVRLGEVTIRPGRVVHLLIGSANRDERCFADPDRLDIRRDPNPHLSFGAGLHSCLGAGLGRLETTAVLAGLLDRCAALVADRPPLRRPVQVFRTYESLPARVVAA